MPVATGEEQRESLQDVLNVVASGSDSSGLKPETGKAVKGDTEGTYWLAMKFTADGFNGDTETGIWLVSGLDAASAAPVMSVDGFAKQFTHWSTQINGTELNGREGEGRCRVSGLICNSPPTLCGGCCIIARAWRVISG